MTIRASASFAAILWLLASAPAAAQQQWFHLVASPQRFLYGESQAYADVWIHGTAGCTAPSLLAFRASEERITYTIDGVEYGAQFGGSCDATNVWALRWIGGTPWGTHEMRARYVSGTEVMTSEPVTFEVRPAFRSQTAAGWIGMGVGKTKLLGYPHGSKCVFKAARIESLGAPGMPAVAPVGATLPHGLLAYEFEYCESSSGSTTGPGRQRMLLEVQPQLPRNATIWSYGVSAQDATPKWRELPVSIEGRYVLFQLEEANLLRGVIAVGSRESAPPTSHQGIWWGGPDENGWGMSITQHGDTYFAALFVYDASGNPRWMVMPGGTWDGDRRAYRGSLYRPRGSPWNAYDARAFRAGAAVGSMGVSFLGDDQLRIDYTVDGVSGSKMLVRQAFGAPSSVPVWRFDDLWWGSAAQNGWGLAIAQQHQSLFAVWFTYDEAGETTWFVVPDGGLNHDALFAGTAYRTRGSPWLGTRYDATQLSATRFGEVMMRFEEVDRGFFQVELYDGSRVYTPVERQPF